MACVCMCLLPRLRLPGFSPAVACLAQSQGPFCLHKQASMSQQWGRQIHRMIVFLLILCFCELKVKRKVMKYIFCVVYYWATVWLNGSRTKSKAVPNHTLSWRSGRAWMETGHIRLSVGLSACERRLPLNDVWQARQRRLWVLKYCCGVTEMWSVGSGGLIR